MNKRAWKLSIQNLFQIILYFFYIIATNTFYFDFKLIIVEISLEVNISPEEPLCCVQGPKGSRGETGQKVPPPYTHSIVPSMVQIDLV